MRNMNKLEEREKKETTTFQVQELNMKLSGQRKR